MLGNYTIQVDGSWANALSISVAEYKLPMFKVEFDPVKEGTSFGKPLTIKGSAVSYSGVPQDGAEVEYTISRRTNPFFRLYLPMNKSPGSSVVDKAGNFAITFIPKRESSEENINKEQAYIYTVTATITAPTGETVEQSVSVQVGDSPISFLFPHRNISTNINRQDKSRPKFIRSTDRPYNGPAASYSIHYTTPTKKISTASK